MCIRMFCNIPCGGGVGDAVGPEVVVLKIILHDGHCGVIVLENVTDVVLLMMLGSTVPVEMIVVLLKIIVLILNVLVGDSGTVVDICGRL